MRAFTATCLALLVVLQSTPVTADITHLNVDHREIVHLVFDRRAGAPTCDGLSSGLFRIKEPSGGESQQEFIVPAGKELVITDVVWAAVPGTSAGWIDGRSLAGRLEVFTETGDKTGDVFDLPIVITPSGETGSYQGGSANLTAGLRIASRRILCPSARQIFATPTVSS